MDILLKINDRTVSARGFEETSLLRFLRDHLRLTGTKCGCSRGECGACMVIVEGRARRSCRLKMKELAGAAVQTIEGLAGPDLHPLQKAFVTQGAVQCGFCTPGVIMAAKALLDRRPSPSMEEIASALSNNLCRCTGYFSIRRAVAEAARMVREGGAPPVSPSSAAGQEIIGSSVIDRCQIEKTTGSFCFADDLYFPAMLYGAPLLSQVVHGEIRGIDTTEAERVPGVQAILTARDVPGLNRFGLIVADQPVLADEKVLFTGDVLALAVADSAETCRQALSLIRVDIHELPVIDSPAAALEDFGPPVHSPGHILKTVTHRRGDIEQGFREADVILEREYETPFVEHAYLEPEAGLARFGDDGRLEVWCPTQTPQMMRDQIARSLGLPPSKIRVRGTPAGGAFGGKTDITIQILLALAAWKTKRPVKITLRREESLRMSTKRHPIRMAYRTGVTRSGKFTALQVRLELDAGAYASYSTDVLEQAMVFSGGPYAWPNVKVDGICTYTNNAIGGAFRGFGMNQVHFAIESQIDMLARELGMNPVELRWQNALAPGKETITGETMRRSVALRPTLSAARSGYLEAVSGKPGPAGTKRIGVGVASAYKNIGAGRGLANIGGARLRLLDTGEVELRASISEGGQGTNVILAQIAAAVTGIPHGRFSVVAADSDIPEKIMAIGQRQTMMAGNAVIGAARKFKVAILRMAAQATRLPVEELELEGASIASGGKALMDLKELARAANSFEQEISAADQWIGPQTYPLQDDPNPTYPIMKDGRRVTEYDPEDYRNYFSYNYATQVAVVEVDTRTGAAVVKKILAVHDVGRVLNPQRIRGQLEGSILMGIGYALSEEYVLRRGVPLTRSLRQCGIPDIHVQPEIEIILVEEPEPIGPFQAKGISEIALVPTVPAILNAIFDAAGVRITSLPAKPAKILEALRKNPHPLS